MTKEEFICALTRMFDRIRKGAKSKGTMSCSDTESSRCPIKQLFGWSCDTCVFDNEYQSHVYTERVFNLLDFVEQWSKDHPAFTNADKYEEVWGHLPKGERGEYICPSACGLKKCLFSSTTADRCEKCALDFWTSEYQDPEETDLEEEKEL